MVYLKSLSCVLNIPSRIRFPFFWFGFFFRGKKSYSFYKSRSKNLLSKDAFSSLLLSSPTSFSLRLTTDERYDSFPSCLRNWNWKLFDSIIESPRRLHLLLLPLAQHHVKRKINLRFYTSCVATTLPFMWQYGIYTNNFSLTHIKDRVCRQTANTKQRNKADSETERDGKREETFSRLDS